MVRGGESSFGTKGRRLRKVGYSVSGVKFLRAWSENTVLDWKRWIQRLVCKSSVSSAPRTRVQLPGRLAPIIAEAVRLPIIPRRSITCISATGTISQVDAMKRRVGTDNALLSATLTNSRKYSCRNRPLIPLNVLPVRRNRSIRKRAAADHLQSPLPIPHLFTFDLLDFRLQLQLFTVENANLMIMRLHRFFEVYGFEIQLLIRHPNGF